MNKMILVALLTIWRDKMDTAIERLDAYPILKNGRKQVDIENSDELRELWDVKYSIDNLIIALEKTNGME